MAVVYGGSTVNITIQATSSTSGAQADFQKVSAALQSYGFSVGGLNIQTGGILNEISGAILSLGGYPYTATFNLTLPDDDAHTYSSENDLVSIVQALFANATGIAATGVVANCMIDAQGAETDLASTCDPVATFGSGIVAPSGLGNSVGDAVSSFFSGLSSATVVILWVLAGIIVLVIVLAAYGPNAGAIAKAVA